MEAERANRLLAQSERSLAAIPDEQAPAPVAVRLRYAIIGYLDVFDRCGGSESVSPETFAAARQDLRDALTLPSTYCEGGFHGVAQAPSEIAAQSLLRDLNDYCQIKPATMSERIVWIDQGAVLRERLASAVSSPVRGRQVTMGEQTVPKEFNDANIRKAREFKAERDDLLKANQILQALIGNRDAEVDRLRAALLKIEQETIEDTGDDNG